MGESQCDTLLREPSDEKKKQNKNGTKIFFHRQSRIPLPNGCLRAELPCSRQDRKIFPSALRQAPPLRRSILPPSPLSANAAMTCIHSLPRATSRKCPSPAVHLPLHWPGRYSTPRVWTREGGAYLSRRKPPLARGAIISARPLYQPHVFIV